MTALLRDRSSPADVLTAGCIAAVVSGVPSTAHAILTHQSPLDASLAAGTLLLGDEEQRASRLLPAAATAHIALSLGWALVLAALLPRRPPRSPVAGLAIAALDLGVVGRRFPRIRALPLAPQIADHVAYALTVAAVLGRRRERSAFSSPRDRRSRPLG